MSRRFCVIVIRKDEEKMKILTFIISASLFAPNKEDTDSTLKNLLYDSIKKSNSNIDNTQDLETILLTFYRIYDKKQKTMNI